MRRRQRAGIGVGSMIVLVTVAACTATVAGHGTRSSSPGSYLPRSSTLANLETTLVSGTATDESGQPVTDVLVGFRLSSDRSDPQTATTDAAGSYNLRLRPGDYVTACVASAGSCTVAGSTGGSAEVTIAGSSMTVDFDVVADSSGDSSVPPAPNPPPDNPTAATFSGHAYTTDGHPVRDITIEFQSVPDCAGVCDEPFVNTDDTGSYSIQLDDGTYNAICSAEGSEDYECGPRGGDGGPFPVDVPPQGQQLDFIVCLKGDYPQCLQA